MQALQTIGLSGSSKMKLFVVGCVFIAYFVHVLVASRKGCSFSIHGHQFERNLPILLHPDDFSFVIPSHGRVDLKPGDSMVLVCPDSKNFLEQGEKNVTLSQCAQGSTLRVGNQDVSFEELQCKRTIRGSVRKTDRKCGNNRGRITRIGYQMPHRIFAALIEVCYDDRTGNVLYTEHSINGMEIRYASKSNYRPNFSPDGLGPDISAVVSYKQAFQKATLSRILGSSSLASRYIHEKSFLARGHLAPDADFLYATWQHTSYYYINTVPQWQVINAGNWKKIEILTRKAAEHLRETLTIVTGSHGVLQLPDSSGNLKEIYLVSGDKMPVPKFAWKIIHSAKSHNAVVLIILNNPFVVNDESKENAFPCKSICLENGWNVESWVIYDRGLVHCCDYGSFVSNVPTSPKLTVSGVLQGPN